MSIEIQQEELIGKSYEELEKLKGEVTQLENIRKNIEDLIGSNDKLPKVFEEKFQKIINLSADYTNTLGAATKKYLDGNNTLFTAKLSDLTTQRKEFEKEITRLVNTDFTNLFKDLQKVFIELTRADLATELKRFEEKAEDLQTKIDSLQKEIFRLVNTDFNKLFKELQKSFIDQTRADLATELKRFEKKSIDLQAKIDELKTQIERLEKIDLDKHFDKLQKTLSEIFGAVNAINLTLTNFVQTLTGIVQTLGTIQITIDTNHKEAKQLLNSFSEATERHLSSQDIQATKNVELLEGKIKSLTEQNELLRSDLKTNRIIQIVGLTIILVILIYVSVKH